MNSIKDTYEIWVRGRLDTGLITFADVGGCNLLLDQHGLLSTPSTIDISSSSASDTSAGTGARTLRIAGLGSTKKYQEEIITLAGQTVVTSSKTWYRIFTMKVLTVGSNGSNVGDIYVIKSGTGGSYSGGVPGTFSAVSALAKSPAGTNQASTCFYTTPNYANGIWRLKHLFVSNRSQAGTVSIMVQDHANNTPITREFYVDFPAGFTETFDLTSLKLDCGPDTDIRVVALGAAGNGIVNATLEITEINPVAGW